MFNNYQHFIFDLDGTIIDSEVDIKLSLLGAINSLGLNLNKEDVFKLQIGPPLLKSLDTLLPQIDNELKFEIIKNFKNIYDISQFDNTRFYPKVRDFLLKLKSIGKIYIATNKRRAPTVSILNKLQILEWFDEIVTTDFLDDRSLSKSEMIKYLLTEHQIDPKQAIMIGDTYHDMIAAQEGNIDSALFLGGYLNKISDKEKGAIDIKFEFDSFEKLY